VSQPRAADDFATIRARLDQLRRERDEAGVEERAGSAGHTADAERERLYRDRREGLPPPWVPTIFFDNQSNTS
jgi:hypothetical protein